MITNALIALLGLNVKCTVILIFFAWVSITMISKKNDNIQSYTDSQTLPAKCIEKAFKMYPCPIEFLCHFL